jgi:exodeoxyribonuclease V alpha subunit
MAIQLNRAPFKIELMVTSQSPGTNSSQIIQGKHDNRLYSVLAKSYVLARPAQPGEWWCFTGEWDTNPRYSNQVVASHGEPIQVQGDRLAEYLIRHPQLRCGERGSRVGRATWQSAISKAGNADKLVQLIDTEDHAGLRALGVGRLTHNIGLVFRNYSILKGELEAVSLCRKHQIPRRLSYRLIKHYGETLPSLLKANCYKILAFEDNTQSLFENCEKIANAMKYAGDDPRRLQGAIDYILNYRLEQKGHTAITRETLFKALVRHFEDDSLAIRAIDNALKSGAIQKSPEGLLQSRPVAYVESMVEKRFVTMIKKGADRIDSKRLSLASSKVYALAEHILTEEQKGAIQLPFIKQLSVISGGAGTGKTTVISSVVRLAQELNIEVFQMALSGQAADVMRRYNQEHGIKCKSRTIHSYLLPLERAEESDDEGELKKHQNFLEKFSEDCLIIIDESSMIDLSLMNRLLCRIPDSARIVMVGDYNQIPPVGSGLVFHLLCRSKNVPHAKLTMPHRSAAETGIPAFAENVSKGIVPIIPLFDLTSSPPDHGLFFLPTTIDKTDPYCLARPIYQVAKMLGLERTQVISTHRQRSNHWGEYIVQSIHHINEYFQSQLTKGHTPELKAWGLNEGDPVIVRKNVINVGGNGFDLFNGSLGELTSTITPYEFTFDGITRELSNEDIANLGIMLGYALTTHSFQGSAAECIVIAVTKSNLLERSLLYTALTRAKKTVVFVGDQQAFTDAVKPPPKWEKILTAFSVDRSFK